MHQIPPRILLRRRQVEERVGLSRTQLDRMIRDGKFPRPVVIGERAVAWAAAEIDAWVAERIAERDAKDAA